MNALSGSYGHFDLAAREYVITHRRTPRPWLNYIWIREFLSVATHTGQGYGFHQDARSLRTNIVAGRRIYIQDIDSGETWSAEGMDASREPDAFRCRHGLGYTIIEQQNGDLESSFRIFTPEAWRGETWTLRITNQGAAARRLRIIAALDTKVDGDIGLQGYYVRAETRYEQACAAIVHITHRYEEDNPPRAVFGTSADITGYDCRYDAFYGPFCRDTFPEAVRAKQMRNTARCEFEKSAMALETRIDLAPGAARVFHFFAGHYADLDEVRRIHHWLRDLDAVEGAFESARNAALRFPQELRIQTDDTLFDAWCATWLKQQIAYNATWARDYFNGYRDLCQDVENLALLDPVHARAKLRQILSFQYPSGFAPRAWLNGRALDHGHGDSPVWITYSVRAVVAETGDLALLDEVVPYYEKDEGTVYDHCRRAMDWYWKDRGENGLCLFRKGDWNDAMIRMGWDGKGTSVWTTMAYHRALLEFAELARWSGREDDARIADERAREIRRIVNDVAWDGEWYLRGFTDAGAVVGSRRNAEGTMYANAQSWAVLSGVADAARARQCMESLDRHLDAPTGVLSIKDPYTKFDIGIGPITGQRPGAYQNQSVYCHTNTFKLAADCMLGRCDAAWRGIWKILPFSPVRHVEWGEPYVMPNCYFGPAAGYRYDQPGQSWMTATAGWLLRVLVRGIFGLEPTLAGLIVKPCFPSALQAASITRVFRDTRYEVTYRRSAPGCAFRVFVDHHPHPEGAPLPIQPGTTVPVSVEIGG